MMLFTVSPSVSCRRCRCLSLQLSLAFRLGKTTTNAIHQSVSSVFLVLGFWFVCFREERWGGGGRGEGGCGVSSFWCKIKRYRTLSYNIHALSSRFNLRVGYIAVQVTVDESSELRRCVKVEVDILGSRP